MFRHKWLAAAGAAILSASALLSFGALPAAAAGPLSAIGPQHDHARPPINYAKVTKPVSRNKPGQGPSSTSVVYTPSNIQNAYNFGSFAGGSGQAIAIVDAYGDPTLSTDVATFDNQWGLGNANINVYYPDGVPTSNNNNWAVETALDVEWAHANAPDATIDVIVAPSSSFQGLLDCIIYATNNLDVAAISMSWGSPESNVSASTFSAYESAFSAATSKGVVLLGASGDQGATDGTSTLNVDYPASSPEVTGVGGTTLTLNSSGGYGSETAWSSSGGGYSVKSSEPTYQSADNIPDSTGMRGVPDVAFDANPNTGVYVYCNGSWYAVGGTSVGAPNWAAIVADNAAASSGHSLNNGYLYGTVYGVGGTSGNYSSDMHDVTSGNNGYYSAGLGWDAVTGLGSPDVASLINAPTPSPDFSLSVSPASQSVVQGSSTTYTVTVNPMDGFAGTVSFAVTGLPSGATASFSPISSTSSTLTIVTSATTPTGSYTFTITGTDNSLSHSISAGLTVTSSSVATKVSVNNINYATSGGKNGKNNLLITVSLVNNLSNPVPSASVSIEVDHNGSPYASGTGTTGSNGSVTFTISHAPSGTYTTTVTNVTASGLTWDGTTPSNSYTK